MAAKRLNAGRRIASLNRFELKRRLSPHGARQFFAKSSNIRLQLVLDRPKLPAINTMKLHPRGLVENVQSARLAR